MLYVTIDRIEPDEHGNQLATLVFDDGQQLIVPLDRLPEGAREGTVCKIDLSSDQSETERRRNQIEQVQSRLFGHRTRASDQDIREHK